MSLASALLWSLTVPAEIGCCADGPWLARIEYAQPPNGTVRKDDVFMGRHPGFTAPPCFEAATSGTWAAIAFAVDQGVESGKAETLWEVQVINLQTGMIRTLLTKPHGEVPALVSLNRDQWLAQDWLGLVPDTPSGPSLWDLSTLDAVELNLPWEACASSFKESPARLAFWVKGVSMPWGVVSDLVIVDLGNRRVWRIGQDEMLVTTGPYSVTMLSEDCLALDGFKLNRDGERVLQDVSIKDGILLGEPVNVVQVWHVTAADEPTMLVELHSQSGQDAGPLPRILGNAFAYRDERAKWIVASFETGRILYSVPTDVGEDEPVEMHLISDDGYGTDTERLLWLERYGNDACWLRSCDIRSGDRLESVSIDPEEFGSFLEPIQVGREWIILSVRSQEHKQIAKPYRVRDFHAGASFELPSGYVRKAGNEVVLATPDALLVLDLRQLVRFD